MADLQPYTLKQAQALIKDAITRSRKRHKKWRALELLYRQGQVVEADLDSADVPDILWEEVPGLTLDSINIVLPNAQIIIAQSMAHDPAFLVEPYSGGDDAEQQAKFGEQLLRYFWKRTYGTDTHRMMTQDMVILGSGFCKVGWAFAEDFVERDDEDVVEELLELREAERRESVLEERDERDFSDLVDTLELQERRVTQDEPFVEYVSPYDIMVPRHARRIEECRWIAQRVILPMDEIEANENFDPEAVDEITPIRRREDRPGLRGSDEENLMEETASAEFDAGEDPFTEAVIYEFYDMRTRRMMVLTENAEKPLFDDDLPYSHRHAPFVHMRNMEDSGRRFWPFGDVENVAAIQEEFNQYVFEQMASARRSGNKYVIDVSVYDDDVKKLLESEQSDVAIPLRLGTRNIDEVIQALQREPLPAEVFQAKHDLADSMRDVMGISEMQAGGVGPDRASATQMAVVDGNATLRAADKKHQVEHSAAEAGLRMLLLCQEYLDEELALRIVGPDGAVEWLNVSKEDLWAEFGVSVHAGSTQAVNPATRMARALDLMTEIIPALAADGYDTHPIWRQAIRDYGLDPDRVLQRAEVPPEAEGGGIPMEEAEGLGGQPTVPQEELGGPPIQAATAGDIAL